MADRPLKLLHSTKTPPVLSDEERENLLTLAFVYEFDCIFLNPDRHEAT